MYRTAVKILAIAVMSAGLMVVLCSDVGAQPKKKKGPPLRSIPGTGQPYYPGQWSPYYPPPRRRVYPYYPPRVAPVYPQQNWYWSLGANGSDYPPYGVYLTAVTPNGAAERMGIEMGDTVVQVNGRPIRSMYDLNTALSYSQGYARILVLDNRTGTYMWHQGNLDYIPPYPPVVNPPVVR